MTGPGASPIPREARPYQGRRAGLVTRLVANTIDAVLVGVLLLAALVGVNGLRFLVHPVGFQFGGAPLLLSLGAALVVLVAYLALAWAVTGRTYGDHVMGLRVVTRRGGRLPPVRALLRAGLCTVFPIGILWCAEPRSRLSIQDVLLRTQVVYDWGPTPWGRRSAG